MKVDRSKTEYMRVNEKEGGKVNLHGVEIVKVRNKWIKNSSIFSYTFLNKGESCPSHMYIY